MKIPMSDRDRLADLLITHRCYYHPGSGHYQCRGCEWEGYEPTEHIADALIIAGVTMPAPEQGRCAGKVQFGSQIVQCAWHDGHEGLCR